MTQEGGLEDKLKDAYLVSVDQKIIASAEAQQRYETLVVRADQLQQQYGDALFSVSRRFAYAKAIAATIHDEKLVSLLQQEGYVVEQQNELKAQEPRT